MAKREENNPHVSRAFCNERFARIEGMFKHINDRLDEDEEKHKTWKGWLLGVVSSIITGLIVAAVTIL